ncbi:MAG: hypothetical protein JJ973_00800 [Rhodospirillales bacterium]|nr:hypothetical protein [Rhodospirillales bacterium]
MHKLEYVLVAISDAILKQDPDSEIGRDLRSAAGASREYSPENDENAIDQLYRKYLG